MSTGKSLLPARDKSLRDVARGPAARAVVRGKMPQPVSDAMDDEDFERRLERATQRVQALFPILWRERVKRRWAMRQARRRRRRRTPGQ